jgi:putative oxidoreductase
MKIAVLIARIILGLIFVVFGLNGFLNFLHGPLPTGLAGEFVDALIKSHYTYFVAGLQVISGALLLVNRFVPLALVLLGPILVNILLFHLLMLPSGVQIGALCTLLWALIYWRHRQYFAGIFTQRTP